MGETRPLLQKWPQLANWGRWSWGRLGVALGEGHWENLAIRQSFLKERPEISQCPNLCSRRPEHPPRGASLANPLHAFPLMVLEAVLNAKRNAEHVILGGVLYAMGG